jgi:hypothetical protein
MVRARGRRATSRIVAGLQPAVGSRLSPSGQDADLVERHLEALLADTREELGRADHKASLLLAGGGVAIGALLASLFGRQWSPIELDHRVQWLWWLSAAAAAMALLALGDTIYPRTWAAEGGTGGIAFYGDVLAVPRDRLEAEVRRAADRRGSCLADQLFEVSRIVRRKYRAIKVALWMYAAAVSCAIATAVLNSTLT